MIHEKYQLMGPFDKPEKPDLSRVMNNKKVSDHHAIIPTVELADAHLDDLKETEQKILFLIAVHTVEAVSREHVFREISVRERDYGTGLEDLRSLFPKS